MKKKLRMILAVVLSLVMVFGLASVHTATVSQAAKKLKFTKTGKKAVKSGEKRTLKISGTKAKKATWSVTGTGKQYIKLAKKQGKTNSFTLKGNATGTAKITAKLTKKNKVSVTYTLSCDAEGIQFAKDSQNVEIMMDEAVTLTVVANPSNAVLPKVSYEVAAVVDGKPVPAGNAVTLKIEENGAVFSASAPGTYNVTATAGEFTATAVVTVNNAIHSAKQTALTEIKAVFQGDIGECSFQPEDFTLVREGGTPAAIKAVEKTGAQELLLTTNEKMNDGGTYTLTYDGYSVSFEATNGLVSALSIEPKTVMVNTPTDVTVSTKDAKGIVLDTYKLGAPDLPKELAFSVKPTGGSVNAGGQLTLASLAGTAEAEAVYTAEDGTEIREKTTITAVKREVELDFEPKVIREAKTTPIHLIVKDKASGEVIERYVYGTSVLPDYLTVTFQPTNGFAEPAAGGLCLANAGATAAVHMEYHKDGAEGSLDGTITARVATEEEKAAEKAEQERQSSSSSTSTVTPAPTPSSSESSTSSPSESPTPTPNVELSFSETVQPSQAPTVTVIDKDANEEKTYRCGKVDSWEDTLETLGSPSEEDTDLNKYVKYSKEIDGNVSIEVTLTVDETTDDDDGTYGRPYNGYLNVDEFWIREGKSAQIEIVYKKDGQTVIERGTITCSNGTT